MASKKKRYSNYIKASFGSRRYTRRYFITKGFPMQTLDDVRCWLFYFKKIGKTTLSLQFYKKEFLFCNSKNIGKFLKYMILEDITNTKVICNGIKLFDLKLEYSSLFSFWFSFFFFTYEFYNFFVKKNKFLFLSFLLFYFDFSLNFIKNLMNEKKNNKLLKIRKEDILEIKYKMHLMRFFINKETKNIKKIHPNLALCNLFSETKNTINNFVNLI